MTTPKYGTGEHAENQVSGEVVANGAYRRIETLASLEVLDRDLATPPGSPANGDAYIVATSPTGAWASQAGKIAFYQDGWLFASPKGGMTAFVKDEKVWFGYSSVESAWHPLQDIWSTTEYWTGLYQDGKKIYSKVVNVNSLLPDIGTSPMNVAHGIAGLDANETILISGSLQLPGAGTTSPLPFINALGGIVEVGGDATNLIFTVNFNAGSLGLRVEWVRMTYSKT